MPDQRAPRCSCRYAARLGDRRVVAHVLVAVGHHRAAPVPPPVADDVHLAGQERVGRADDRADVEVVLPVLDGDVEVVPPGVEVGDDRLHRPVAVAVDDVAPVALGEQPLVVPLPRRPAAPPTARRRPRRDRAASGRTAPARSPSGSSVLARRHSRHELEDPVRFRSGAAGYARAVMRPAPAAASASTGWTRTGCSTSSAPGSSGSAW